MKVKVFFSLLAAVLLLSTGGISRAATQSSPKIIKFSGYQWQVKSGDNLPPGSNNWSDANAWVDSNGYLHLKITQHDGKLYSAEVVSTGSFGFGKYQFYVIGQIDQLDKNVVLGMFNYPVSGVSPDVGSEIDIEIARWSRSDNPNANYTVWSAQSGLKSATNTFNFSLNGTYTTQRFIWSSTGVDFQSLHGHQSGNSNTMASWSYKPGDYLNTVPQNPMPVHINLWLSGANAPSGDVEIVISRFTYTKQ